MNRFVVTLRSLPSPNPPGWTLYGQELVLGNSLDCSLVFPFGESSESCLHLYSVDRALYGERLSEELPVTMNGTHLRTGECLSLPDSFMVSVGPNIFLVTREEVAFTFEEAKTLLSCHVNRLVLTWSDTCRRSLLMPHFGDLTLGRGEACHLRFSPDTVSRRHATISVREGFISLTAHTESTFCNGKLVKNPCTVDDHSTITLGDLAFHVARSSHLPSVPDQ